MSAEITITGNLTRDPELAFTNGGDPYVRFSIAVNHNKLVDGQWVEDSTSFFDCTAWRELATNIADSLVKGLRVVVQGTIKQEKYTNKDGVDVTTYKVQANDVLPSLRWATVAVTKNERGDNVGGRQASSRQTASVGARAAQPAFDEETEPF